jgi:hypothetical protein
MDRVIFGRSDDSYMELAESAAEYAFPSWVRMSWRVLTVTPGNGSLHDDRS